MEKKFIEETFPIKKVSEESAREKNIRHGHISTLHIWWARRPLASSRATIYASLIPEPPDSLEETSKLKFIEELAKWENTQDQRIIEKARQDIHKEYKRPPRVLDPFAGGGSIPLEAMRLGCEAHALEYNPVATLILKCTLEYPQKYGKPKTREWAETENPLLEDVKKWGEWVLDEVKKEIGRFYPKDDDGSIPVGYIWARTLPCQNPRCGIEIPLMRQFWLVRKKNKKIALKPIIKEDGVDFEIVENPDFDPSKGTISRAIVTCPACKSTIPANETKKLFQEGKNSERLVAVATTHPQKRGKQYRLPTKKDYEVFKKAEEYLREKREKLKEKWVIDPIPNEPIKRVPFKFGVINVWVYSIERWGDLFNSRQKLALITFTEKIRKAHKKMLKKGYDKEYAKAITTYLSFVLSKLSDWNSSLSLWRPDQERNEHLFSRQALPMIWDYSERNPFNGRLVSTSTIESVIENCSKIPTPKSQTHVIQGSATRLPYPDNYFDAVFTDPPYYDNVPYSYLSDFFYVWLKRAIGNLYPDLFLTPLTPKREEMVAYTHGKTMDDAKREFEEMLSQAFKEIYRVLKPGGIANIVYAHKTTQGWETFINSILKAGFVVTAFWPISTEMPNRLRAQKSKSLQYSIYFILRKNKKRKNKITYEKIKNVLKDKIKEKFQILKKEGVSGLDLSMCGYAVALEVLSQYDRIVDRNSEIIVKILEDVEGIVEDTT